MDLIPTIHHDKQEAGSMLCAQHAINNLLQAPYLTVDALGQIARSLDEAEAANLDPEAAAALHKDSPNYDDTGFFSLAVIEQALQAFSLSLVRWQSPEMADARKRPEQLEGFILNHDVHWYCLRKFANNKRWYKIDSCEDSPEWISPTYLGMYLQQAEEQGYSIFVVHPVSGSYGLPDCPASNRALNLPAPSATSSSSSRTPLVANHSFGKRAPTPSEHSFTSDLERPRKSRRVQQPPPPPMALPAPLGLEGEGRSPRSASPVGLGGGVGGGEAGMTEEEELAAAIAASLEASRIDSAGEGSQGEKGKGRKGKAEVVTLESDSDGDDEISFVPVPKLGNGKGKDQDKARQSESVEPGSRPLRPLALPRRPSHSAPAASPAPTPHRSRGDVEEDEMLAAALKASLEDATPGKGQAVEEKEQGVDEDEEDYDEPSPEEMRRRRLARFG